MIQIFLTSDHSNQFSVSRKFRLTENNTNSAYKVEQNSVIKKFLTTARDVLNIQHTEQNEVIRKFLTTAENERHNDF